MNTKQLHSASRQFDDLLAVRVMDWRVWNGDWHEGASAMKNLSNWRADRLWRPTADPRASQLVWIRCLVRAKEMGYELKMSVDDKGRYHINGDHPVAKRLLVIDFHPDILICRFAALLFGLSAPDPYDHNPLEPEQCPCAGHDQEEHLTGHPEGKPPPYALYDVEGKCWIGTDSGVQTYDDWELACLGATVIGEQLRRLLHAQPYDGSAKKLKDEVPVQMSAEEAVVRLEGKREP